MNKNINIFAPITNDGYYTVNQIAEKLKYIIKPFPKQIVREAIKNRSEITPKLLEFLDYAHKNHEGLDENYIGHFYALYLLAEFKETQAFELAINILKLPENSLELLLGDCLTEDYPSILVSLYNGNLDIIKNIIETQNIYEYARDAALDTLIGLVAESKLDRDEIIEYLSSLLDNNIFRNDAGEMSYLICSIANLRPTNITVNNKVREIFDLKLTHPFILSLEDYNNDMLNEYDQGNLRDNFGYIKSAIDSMSCWVMFTTDETLGTKQIKSIKTSRNDPCPCGSGKKYKKCCLK